MTTAQAVAIICGVVVPFLVDLVTKSRAPRWLKSGLALALSTLAGVLATVTWAPGASWRSYVVTVAEAWVVALATHYTGATGPVQHKTAKTGLG